MSSCETQTHFSERNWGQIESDLSKLYNVQYPEQLASQFFLLVYLSHLFLTGSLCVDSHINETVLGYLWFFGDQSFFPLPKCAFVFRCSVMFLCSHIGFYLLFYIFFSFRRNGLQSSFRISFLGFMHILSLLSNHEILLNALSLFKFAFWRLKFTFEYIQL